MAQARKLACNMKMMFAMLHKRPDPQPKKPEQQMMGYMVMPEGTRMSAGSM